MTAGMMGFNAGEFDTAAAGGLLVGVSGLVVLLIGAVMIDTTALPYKSATGVVLENTTYDGRTGDIWVRTPDGDGEMDAKGGPWMWDAAGQHVQVFYTVGRLSHGVSPHVILPWKD